MEIYASARKHGIGDVDIDHAIEHALVSGVYQSFLAEQGDADG